MAGWDGGAQTGIRSRLGADLRRIRPSSGVAVSMTNETNSHQQPARRTRRRTNGRAERRAANDHESAPDHPAVSGKGAVMGVDDSC